MKYQRLSKDQFKDLNFEFAQFLSSQSIDKKSWDELKTNKPQLAEDELDIFSDMVWDRILTSKKYFNHISKNQVVFFFFDENHAELICLKHNSSKRDFNIKDDYLWLINNFNDSSVEVIEGKKQYTKERNEEFFDVVKKGGDFDEDETFEFLKDNMIKKR